MGGGYGKSSMTLSRKSSFCQFRVTFCVFLTKFRWKDQWRNTHLSPLSGLPFITGLIGCALLFANRAFSFILAEAVGQNSHAFTGGGRTEYYPCLVAVAAGVAATLPFTGEPLGLAVVNGAAFDARRLFGNDAFVDVLCVEVRDDASTPHDSRRVPFPARIGAWLPLSYLPLEFS